MKFVRVVLCILIAGCARDTAPSTNAGFETVATGLYVPWAMAFAPDGRLFVTERAGRIRVVEGGQLRPEPWAKVDNIVSNGESGLMGIALSPNFASDGYVYVVGTFASQDHLINRVLRFTETSGSAGQPEVLIDNIPAARFHAGDAIAFGPDGMLYIATGDAGDPESAQDMKSLAGKILRFTPDGAIPADNPFAGSPVYALGLRNVQGLGWSKDGQMFATDHGPSGFPSERLRRNHDELNVILRGRNYGWPNEAGFSDDARFISPLTDWSPAIAPSGVAIMDDWAYVGALRGKQLRRVRLERSNDSKSGWRASREEVLFGDELGRIRAVALGPDGNIYFTTSNSDGRGDPGPTDDRILRLILK